MKTSVAKASYGSLILVVMVVAVTGCGKRYAGITPDDEAMKRLKWEDERSTVKVRPKDAAKSYFLPEYYYRPNEPLGKGITDYFPGMDRIVVAKDWSAESEHAPPLQVPVFQLLDKLSTAPDKPKSPEVPSQSQTAATSGAADDPATFPATKAGDDPSAEVREGESTLSQVDDQQADAQSETLESLFRVEVNPLKTNQEILGRNTWMLWCGGNEGFWDWLCRDSLGFVDLLKLIDSRNRSMRFDKGGLINEPGMTQSGGPDQFGLWLDIPTDGEARAWRERYLKSTFDLIREGQHKSQRGLTPNRQKEFSGYRSSPTYESVDRPYPKDEMKPEYKPDSEHNYEYNSKIPPPEIYGISSGVVGLRLFPNPYFDAEAERKWNVEKYFSDKDYWNDPFLIRPYRVGVACAYCHASFHPLNPPRDIINPTWDNISGNIGAQYLRIRVAFANLLEPENFVYHLLDSQPPGTIDTSLIASDNINNPNTMNSVFNLTQRAVLSLRNPHEVITANSASQPSLWDFERDNPVDPVPQAYLDLFKEKGLLEEALKSNSHPPRRVPRILLDGSDSIGAWGALARVYLNIGTYWEQWQRLHRTVVGFEPQHAFTIADCERHSLYWHATQDRVAALRDYFLKVSPSMPLLATDGAPQLTEPIAVAKIREQAKNNKEDFSKLFAQAKARHIDINKLRHGRKVFAKNCIVCHSSIQPKLWHDEMDRAAKLDEFWIHGPAKLLSDLEYMKWAEEEVERPDFWRENFLSSDYRVPITLVKTNAGRAMATNAMDQNMWDDFASESYQQMPSVGAIEYFDPYDGPDGKMKSFTPQHKVRNDAQAGGGGPGFYRVPTLVSIWATAPLLHNNSLGTFNNDPSINGRLDAFDDAIRKLLWPERRFESSSYNGATPERLKRDRGLIWRTPQETYLDISGRRVPTLLGAEVEAVMRISTQYPWLRKIRPLWLPSGILLLASFLMLLLNSQKKRIVVGIVSLSLAILSCLLWCYGNALWSEWIYPLSLVSALLFGVGFVFLAIDSPRRLRYVAYAALILSALGFVVYWLDGIWPWLAKQHEIGPIGQLSRWLVKLIESVPIVWLSSLFALAGFLLLLTGRDKLWRSRLVVPLAIVTASFLLVYSYDANVGGPTLSTSVGPVWLYLVLIFAAAVVLLTPERRELTRYVGYASLALSLTFGGLVYFFAGKLGDLHVGPIPKGTPVNLLANLNPDADPKQLRKAIKVTIGTLAEIDSKHLDDERSQKLLRKEVAPALMEVSKCPDFVMDHGHYFDWFDDMTDDDKEALIELLKTF